MNEHEATLVMCCYDDVRDKSGKENFVERILEYNNSYPDINIFFSVPGMPGGFVWDGNMEDVVDYSKELIFVIEDNNLTNIKGLAYDIEGPMPNLMEGKDSSPNKQRHDESIEIWEDFFDWMDDHYPEMELRAINYVESGVDVFDNDEDLH